MTPAQKKAKELIERFKPLAASWIETNDKGKYENAKQCALICVEELIKLNDDHAYEYHQWKEENDFLKEVKSEIECTPDPTPLSKTD